MVRFEGKVRVKVRVMDKRIWNVFLLRVRVEVEVI